MFKKEDAVQLLNDSNAVIKLKARSEAYKRAHNVSEIDEAINYLTSRLGIQELVTDVVGRLEEERRQRQIDFTQEGRLDLWAFGQVESGNMDLLLPLEFVEDSNYTWLEQTLFGHCTRALEPLGKMQRSEYSGFLNMTIRNPDLSKVGAAVQRLMVNPQELQEANIMFGLHFTYHPIFIATTRETGKPRKGAKTPIKGKRGFKADLLAYAQEHGGITVDEGVRYTGRPKINVYHALHAARKAGLLKKADGQVGRYEVVGLPAGKKETSTGAAYTGEEKGRVETALEYLSGKGKDYRATVAELKKLGVPPYTVTYMKKAGLLKSPGFGEVQITRKGLDRVK